MENGHRMEDVFPIENWGIPLLPSMLVYQRVYGKYAGQDHIVTRIWCLK